MAIPSITSLRHVSRALRRGYVGGIVGLVAEMTLGRNLWIGYLERTNTHNGLIPFETHDITVLLDPADRGISRDFLVFGGREEMATTILREELRRLGEQIDGTVTVLDIGANRGYYAFQFADILGDAGTVFAIEPEPQNVESLRQGIDINGLDNVTVCDGAIGDEDGTAEMRISNRSNSHTLDPDLPVSQEHKYHASMQVPVWTIETFLEKYDLDAGAINVVKIDVEGYESAVVEAMAPLFAAGKPDILFVELHPHRVDTEDLDEILETLEGSGFEIITASSGVSDSLPTYHAVKDHLAVADGKHTVELVVRSGSEESFD